MVSMYFTCIIVLCIFLLLFLLQNEIKKKNNNNNKTLFFFPPAEQRAKDRVQVKWYSKCFTTGHEGLLASLLLLEQ